MRICKNCGTAKPEIEMCSGRNLCKMCRRTKRKYRKCPECDKFMSEQALLCSTCSGLARRKGTTWISSGGYRWLYAPEHFGSDTSGQIAEHRYVMELNIGRKLLSTENVHHINGDKLDNSLGNLELWSHFQPRGQRIQDKLEWAREIIRLYG